MIRWLAAAAVTVGVNILLLLIMARLVEGGAPPPQPGMTAPIRVDLVELRREQPPPPEPRHRPPPPPPDLPPPPPPPESPLTRAPRLKVASVPMPAMNIPLRLGEGPYIGAFVPPPGPAVPALETDVMPLVRIDPRYPRRALLASIEGHVVVELTIEPDGSVSDPQVVEAQPRGMFESSVLRAVRRWRFAPKVVDGQAVARRAVQTVRFSLSGRGR